MSPRSNWPHRAIWLATGLVAALTVGNCGEGGNGITEPPVPDGSAVVVTEPVLVDLRARQADLAPWAGRGAGSVSPAAVAQEEVSFVSYAPGSIPGADSIEVRNLTRNVLVGAPMFDGGVDPIAIPASVGDTLEITVFQQTMILERTTGPVPPRKPPVVVRTEPPRGRTRIPINASFVIVFSEPISGPTITPETIRLLKGGQPVSGTLTQSADGLTVVLAPDQLLEQVTTYTLSITTGVRDLADDALETEFTSDFTTVGAQLSGEIVFESDRARYWSEIWSMKTDGSDLYRITDHVRGGEATGPALSPDGRKVAFSVAGPASGEAPDIYVINVDGTGLTNLTSHPALDGWRPAWSPDGQEIAFFSTRDDPTNAEVYVMDADGSNVRRLTDHPAAEANMTWSPDGTRIAWETNRKGDWDIWIMNADGTNPTALTADPADDWWPAWSPDGSKIAFQSLRDGDWEIYVMNPDGSNVVRLTNSRGTDSMPAWSRDGTRIAFVSARGSGQLDIWIMNADGTNPVNLTNDWFQDWLPSWSP